MLIEVKKDMFMKTILLVISLCLSSFFSFGQCDYLRNEIDEFTKIKILETDFKVLSYASFQSEVIRVQGVKLDDQKALRCYFVRQQIFSLEAKSKFMLLNEEGEVFTLFNPKHQIAKHNGLNAWYCIVNYPLNSELYQDLIDFIPVKARYYTTEGYVQHEVKKKRSKRIVEVLSCL